MSKNAIIKPKSFDPYELKKFKVTFRVGSEGNCGWKMTHIAYGIDEKDAVNNDKLKWFGWGCDWTLLNVHKIPGKGNSRYVNILKTHWDYLQN